MVLIGFDGFVCSERMFLDEVFVRLIRCAELACGLSILNHVYAVAVCSRFESHSLIDFNENGCTEDEEL